MSLRGWGGHKLGKMRGVDYNDEGLSRHLAALSQVVP